jgi:hypothetical protein
MAVLVPDTADRVRNNTAPEVNRVIDNNIINRVKQYANASKEDLNLAIRALDEEWDIERILEFNASTLLVFSLLMFVLRSGGLRKLWFPITVAGFLWMHAFQGWCPPVPVFRAMGFRTAAEIFTEKNLVKALRGDFEGIRSALADAAADNSLAQRDPMKKAAVDPAIEKGRA